MDTNKNAEGTSYGNPYEGMTTQQRSRFKYWQNRTLIATMVGYALFYFVRKNLSIAMPYLEQDLGVTKTDLGLFLTLHGLIYGLSKFVNGFIGDRTNARIFMVSGLVLSAVMNILFGFSSAVIALGLFWVLNGWFQGMGYPPCARLMTHWIPPYQLATKMSIWNTSHSIGAGLVVVFCSYVVSQDWSWTGIAAWRWCFYLPAVIAIVGALLLWIVMRDTPSSVGLPELKLSKKEDKKLEGAEAKAEYKAFLRKKVFMNPAIWIISVGNFFVYTVRFAILDWGPSLLKEYKHMDITDAGWSVAAFEIAGITGMLAAGWITDKVFGGRAPRTCVFCMLFAAIFMYMFWQMDHLPVWAAVMLLVIAGFFIYGPQALVGIASANMATKRAAATAGGFTGLFGYASVVVSGWLFGYIAQHFGWSYVVGSLIVVAALGTITFMLAWKAAPNGYED